MSLHIASHWPEICKWMDERKSKAYIARELGCNIKTLDEYFKKFKIEYSGNGPGKGQTKKSPAYMPLEKYLKMSKSPQSNKIRKKLLREGYKEHQCEICKNTEWMDKPIPLEVHHIDGNKNNNTLSNFMIVCPNCHAFTDSYRGKNRH